MKQDAAGWYVLHNAPIPAGCIGDWRKNILEKWCTKDKLSMTARERVENLQLLAQARDQITYFIFTTNNLLFKNFNELQSLVALLAG